MPSSRSWATASAAIAVTLALAVPMAGASIVDSPIVYSGPDSQFVLQPNGSYDTGVLDESAAEMVEFYAAENRLLVVNAARAKIDVLDGAALPAGIRIFGGREDAGTGTPAYPVSENLEPEYVTVGRGSKAAFVTLQENNGLAVVDFLTATIARITPLGTVDHTAVPFDASDKDGAINVWTS